MKILVINVGSTSLKYKLFQFPEETVLASGRIEGIGRPEGEFRFQSGQHPERSGAAAFPDYSAGIAHLLDELLSPRGGVLTSLDEVSAVGFKTVLAKNIIDAAELNDDVIAAMEALSPIAPTHNPPYIETIRSFRALLPGTPMIGLFEPAFHNTIPEHAWRYPLPYNWAEKYGIRRYGFHGASHRWAAERAAQMTGRRDLRLISCHLGGSSSVNATRGGISVDNSFGLSPQSGLVQSNRPGDIDPIIPVWMIEQLGMTTADVRRVLSAESGLIGLSGGISAEMRDILAAARESPSTAGVSTPSHLRMKNIESATPAGEIDPMDVMHRAQVTVDAFVYQIRKAIGAATTVLGGLDCLVFTGGIGERSANLRGRICRDMDFLGIALDPAAHAFAKPDVDVAPADATVRVLIIEANEELIVARACVEKLA